MPQAAGGQQLGTTRSHSSQRILLYTASVSICLNMSTIFFPLYPWDPGFLSHVVIPSVFKVLCCLVAGVCFCSFPSSLASRIFIKLIVSICQSCVPTCDSFLHSPLLCAANILMLSFFGPLFFIGRNAFNYHGR